MRVEVLSDHPADMLASAARARGTGTGGNPRSVKPAISRDRDAARRQRRWLAWLRLPFAGWRAKRAAARPPAPATVLTSSAPTDSELALQAGSRAEQRVADELGRALGQEWVLFRGYRNGRGEIDGVLLGPGGLFAYEVKYHNATVYIRGDAWAGEKYDNYGNLVEPRRPITDRGSRGRSPSQQLNEPAGALAAWLARRGYPVEIARVVLLTHPKARIGSSNGATVRVVTSPAALLRLVEGSAVRVGARQRAEVAEVIRRDHQHHNGRGRR
jgi:hypothetical protein